MFLFYKHTRAQSMCSIHIAVLSNSEAIIADISVGGIPQILYSDLFLESWKRLTQ
jgi:hypothetical protein